jgi:transposase
VPTGLGERLAHDWGQLQSVDSHVRALTATRRVRQRELGPQTGRALGQLQTLRAIGPMGGWVLATEIFGWRQIQNRRELAALVGLVPAAYQSGETHHDQGITRAGNTDVRRIMVQLAWGWLRFQPHSALTQWYQRRFRTGKRLRRIGIVALARKLFIALWRYLETGTIEASRGTSCA